MWSWNYTTWVTNELDTESISVRLLMITLMLLSLLMSVAIPGAFDGQALLFAGSYVAIQVGRHTFLTFFASGPGTVERERAGRILTWFVAAGVLWIAGALVDGPARVALWMAALALDYLAPLVIYWVPGLRRLAGAAWNVGTEHFAERAGMKMGLALESAEVVRPTLDAVGRRSTVLPGLLSKVLTYSLAPLPRWARVRIMGRVMDGMTKHGRGDSQPGSE